VKTRWFLGYLTALLLLISCSGSVPVIDDIKWRVLYRDDGVNRFEELSVFLRISDPDGPEDLSIIRISAGDSSFIWRFPRDAWLIDTVSGVEWYGLPGIIPLDGFRLPDTLYTLKLEDLAGRSDERTFRPDPDRPELEQLNWPRVYFENEVLHLEGDFDEGMLILRDESLVSLDVLKVSNGTRINKKEAVMWELWISLADTSGGFRLGPYPFLSVSETE